MRDRQWCVIIVIIITLLTPNKRTARTVCYATRIAKMCNANQKVWCTTCSLTCRCQLTCFYVGYECEHIDIIERALCDESIW